MTFSEFQASLGAKNPPEGLDSALMGLWRDAKNNWARAHESAQEDEGPRGAWAHAYLHRKEGDNSNAVLVWSGRQNSVSRTV